MNYLKKGLLWLLEGNLFIGFIFAFFYNLYDCIKNPIDIDGPEGNYFFGEHTNLDARLSFIL